MDDINFRPWVGEKYLTTGFQGKRILVLGESHYCKVQLAENGRCYPYCRRMNMDESCLNQTIRVVDNVVYHYKRHPYQKTFLCFERAVVGKELKEKEREDFWQSVMFYNYIQHSQKEPRRPPSAEHWEKSEKAFVEVLETYMPDCIIVWGVRLFKSLPKLGGKKYNLPIKAKVPATYRLYTIDGKQIPALQIYHPSAGFSWKEWHDVIDCFFQNIVHSGNEVKRLEEN